MKKKKVVFYVDGFNFYFGLKEMSKSQPDWRKFYWIDIVKFFSRFLQEDEELVVVNYFTARPKSSGKRIRQDMLMNCNKAISGNLLKLYYGKYQDKSMKCRADDGCGKEYMHWEEKQSDVSLAIKIVEDCHNKICDKVILVSGDSDFLPPLKLMKKYYPQIELAVFFPPCKYTSSIVNLGVNTLGLDRNKSRWNQALLPEIIELENGKKYRKPTEWFS